MNQDEARRDFYTTRVPRHFNRTLRMQRQAAASDPEAARVLEEMEAVRSAIVVWVEGDGSDHDRERYTFEIERGSMRCVDETERAPFLVLCHTRSDFESLRRECGDSLLGFLGRLAGLGDEMRLTAARVRSLRELDGALVFERVGRDGFALLARFGGETRSAEPRSTIRLDAATYGRLQRGELDPQTGFLEGQIEVEGDEAMAIGLALAATAPD